MSLLLQLNGAIPESPHDRMFYVFSCKTKTCRRKKGSVRALRAVKVPKDYEDRETKAARAREEEARRREERRKEEDAMPRAGDLLFGNGNPFGAPPGGNPFGAPPAAGANPFATQGGNPFAANPFAAPKPVVPAPTEQLAKSFADTLKISDTPVTAAAPEPLLYGPSEPWPSPMPHQYPLFYLDADYETLTPEKPVDQKIMQLLTDDDDSAADALPASNSDADDGVLDSTFQVFSDRAGQNPEQVLRYERGGVPLLYADNDDVARALLDSRGEYTARKVPACTGCGKRERLFEFQLMPHAISVLEGDSLSLEGMDWGTIVVQTCTCTPKARDANGVGWVEEWVGVQWEGQK